MSKSRKINEFIIGADFGVMNKSTGAVSGIMKN